MKSMKNLSRSLTRSRNCQAVVVLSADNTDSPTAPYEKPKLAYAIANLGSSSTARRKKGRAATCPEDKVTFIPVLKAFNASSEDVVASARGVECFSTVASDSPTRVLNVLAIWLSEFRTSSLLAATACSWSRI